MKCEFLTRRLGVLASLALMMLFAAPQAASAQSRERKVEADGFVWFELKGNNELRGAANAAGKIIIPIRYDDITYHTQDESGYFCVEIGDFEGAYTAEGRCIIEANRYDWVSRHGEAEEGFYYSVEIGDKEGACDANGREIIAPRVYDSVYRFGDPEEGFYYSVEIGDKEGICDANGREVIAPHHYDSATRYGDLEEGFYYGVEINELKGACNMEGREIVAPRYEHLIFSGGTFKYKNDAGRWIPLNIDINGNRF